MTAQRVPFLSFATVAERDAYWPAATAPLGAQCVTLDTHAQWELNDQTGARKWTPPWNISWGSVTTPAVVTAGQSGIGNAMTALTGYALTAVAVNNRRWRISTYIPRIGIAAVGSEILINVQGGVTGTSLFCQTRFNVAQVPSAGSIPGVYIETQYATVASTHLMSVALQCTASTASLSYVGLSSGFLSVEDIGPSTPVPV